MRQWRWDRSSAHKSAAAENFQRFAFRTTLAAISILAMAGPGGGATPQTVVQDAKDRAALHRFEGTILIGARDGSEVHFSTTPALDSEAVWRWASITKQLVAVLIMQEVARGKLDLDAPASRYWPRWRAPQRDRIRIRDLLLHKSGLPQPDVSPADAQGIPGFYRSTAAPPSRSANGYCAGTSRADPPAQFEYNNCDTIVLAEVLKRVTGKSFAQLAHERLARPLNMRRFGMFHFGRPVRSHVAPTGEYSALDPLINLGVNGASGGAYGTIVDLWRFDHALLSGRLLPASARERMWRSSRDNGFYGFHQWIYPASLRGCSTPVRVVERQGLIGGIELRNYLLPERGYGVILFSRHRPTRLGDPFEGEGFAFDLLSLVACHENEESSLGHSTTESVLPGLQPAD